MRQRKFWGWGFADEGASEAEVGMLAGLAAQRFGVDSLGVVPPPAPEEISLGRPRVQVPASLAGIVTADHHARLVHALGRSFPDQVKPFLRDFTTAPDLVAFPRDEADIAALMDWAGAQDVALIPFGGGSSVVGGVTPPGDRAALSLDMGRLDRIREIDRTSRAALIEGGMFGPALEAGLKPHGLTLRHFPQSFEFSTLGGWIVTRSGGHYATGPTHIEEFVEAVTLVTPAGRIETRRLPASGAGPDTNRWVAGSEGAFGILASAWMRLQDIPKQRLGTSIAFDGFHRGAEAIREIVQAGFQPANCRLIDAGEALATFAGDGSADLLVLGFESAGAPLDALMAGALEICRAHGGRFAPPKASSTGGQREGAAGAWRNAFLRAPYYREVLVARGVMVDTFETAITWDRFDDFVDTVKARVRDAILRVTGRPGQVTCRLTHVYADGAAPYFTFYGLGRGDLADLIGQWQVVKQAASDALIELGGTITHHHAVGRDHAAHYAREVPGLAVAALQAVKRRLDPKGIMNPGVLLPG
ncbi:FAD-binding oxidoreductase [Oleomonas cavernae]|uniref:FAD-binding oxidoreductase n=1 Tax=Oleomonas cavernae TaxID=2320859 RepID=A0A418WDP7_9PROT|nr:FAD-binding oxidoreductase [Oleomonas cavernae]RJF88142.1 FAD-binding oxidoreductase [Oleomonas cavernae]